MLRITIELVPGGQEEKAQVIGVATIALQGLNPAHTVGWYKAWFTGKSGRPLFGSHVEVHGFPRKRLLAWDLLYRVLHAAVGERNKV